MKRIVFTFLALAMLFSAVFPCSAFAENLPDVSALTTEELLSFVIAAEEELRSRSSESASDPEAILLSLKNAGLDLDITEVFTEETDTNGLLGRLGQYIGKASFSIGDVTQNTLETFSSAEDCDSRYSYLEQFTDASLGKLGLNQYMYRSELAILRISFDLTPSSAARYETAFYALLGRF